MEEWYEFKAGLNCNESLLKAIELIQNAQNWTNINPKDSVKLDIINDLIEQVRLNCR